MSFWKTRARIRGTLTLISVNTGQEREKKKPASGTLLVFYLRGEWTAMQAGPA